MSIIDNKAELEDLQYKYLKEAEIMFGNKIDYHYGGLSYYNGNPIVVDNGLDPETGKDSYKIMLNGIGAINDLTDGIFQLSHEVVHLISPVKQVAGREINYLEEGMAVYFSKVIIERDTGDLSFCQNAFKNNPKYLKALNLYQELISIDQYAVKKLRVKSPIIADITTTNFKEIGIKASEDLIGELLKKF
ncbi:hypothetical protein [Sphingobacterium sp. R2]|uniref:hypothetical protein n=1 Tax=Sphingobacterium sp. R2 TaxID=3112958 RepID=UPI00345DB350